MGEAPGGGELSSGLFPSRQREKPEGSCLEPPLGADRLCGAQPLLTHGTELRQTDLAGIYKLARFQQIFVKMAKSTSPTSG